MCKNLVRLRNRGLAFEVGADKVILDVVEAAGFILPVGSRYRACIICTAKLAVGKVWQSNGAALNWRQFRAAYVLPYVAAPTTDCVLEVGVESDEALFVSRFATVASVAEDE